MGHELHEECVQSKTAHTNSGMSLLKIGDFLQNNIARHYAKKACCLTVVTYSDFYFLFKFMERIVMNNPSGEGLINGRGLNINS